MRRRGWPRSLAGRVAAILFAGLVAAHALALWLILGAQGETALAMMRNYLPRDVASSIAILERVPAGERPEWLPRLARRGYTYALQVADPGAPLTSPRLQSVVAAIAAALGPDHRIVATVPAGATGAARISLQLTLDDGTPVTIAFVPPPLTISPWIAAILAGQLVVIGLLTWLAVRVATRPLAELAAAADALGAELDGPPLPEVGPREVGRAAVAFNAMQRRIREHLAERVQILAAISHDLQTPLARLRLRSDLLDDAELRAKLQQDIGAMQRLVEQGLAYARSTHAGAEPPRRIDLHALLDSLVCDHADVGEAVGLEGRWTEPVTTRPETLRRVVTNLVENALKFATEVGIAIEDDGPGRVAIVVRDRGPGIPEAELAAVLRPFHRVESSRSRDTGGSGLGLAIADQLTRALGGRLTLANRAGGGLAARVTLPTGVAPRAQDGAAPGAQDGAAPGAQDGAAPGAQDGAAPRARDGAAPVPAPEPTTWAAIPESQSGTGSSQ